MAETKQLQLVASNGRIPQSFKNFRTINVSRSGSDPNSPKVIHVALPKTVVIGRSLQSNIPEFSSSKSDDDTDAGASLSKNALLARENRRKKKQYIHGLEESLSSAKKENENLMAKLKEKDVVIESLKKEVLYFQSILANVKEISSLIKTVKQESTMPFTTSLSPAVNPLKRGSSDAFPEPCTKPKYQRLSESSGEMSCIFDEEEDLFNWIPQSPSSTSVIDTESFDLLSNFHEEDFEVLNGDFGQSTPEQTAKSIASTMPGVCLHVQNKRMSLEFCSSCASKALEKWAGEA